MNPFSPGPFTNRQFLKMLILLAVMGMSLHGEGQIQYHRHLEIQFDSLFKKLPAQTQKEYAKTNAGHSDGHDLAIFIKFEPDTLNPAESSSPNQSTIILIDPKTGKHVKSNFKKEEPPFLFCFGTLFHDSLVIQIGALFPDLVIFNFIHEGSISAIYYERDQNRSFLQKDAKDSLTDTMNIPAKVTRFELSDSSFEIGKMIYGYGEILTPNYLKKDAWEENHFYELRRSMKYYFRFKVTRER
jgi:hypothetical protein